MSQTVKNIQKNLRLLVAEDDLEKAINRLIAITEQLGGQDLHDEALLQSAKLEQYEKDKNLGTSSFEQQNLVKAQIGISTLSIINQLPIEESETANIQPKGIRESIFKMHILTLLLLSKIAIFIYLMTHWEAGGFSVDQFIGSITLLIPVFATYCSLALKDIFQSQGKKPSIQRYSRKIQWLTYFILIAYTVIIWIVIGLKPKGALDYKQMSMLLTAVESGFGVYVGQIVFSLFKND